MRDGGCDGRPIRATAHLSMPLPLSAATPTYGLQRAEARLGYGLAWACTVSECTRVSRRLDVFSLRVGFQWLKDRGPALGFLLWSVFLPHAVVADDQYNITLAVILARR
jgi:hypothetical protein